MWKREKREKGTFIEYSEKEQSMLDYLQREGPSSIDMLSNGISLKKRITSAILVNLVSLGVVQMIFTEKGEFYSLADKVE